MNAGRQESLAAEVEAIREEYRRRSVAPQCRGVYSLLNPTHAYLVLERERAILAALARHLRVPLAEADVLDVGSSSGTSLGLLALYGADPLRLHGVDTDAGRIEEGHRRFPALDLRHSDGMTLPYEDGSFDLVQQITMLSSVRSQELRRQIAGEMLRVARPGALLLSYDVTSVGLAPRVANRLLGLVGGRPRDSAPAAAGPEAGADGPAQAPVVLRQVGPLDEAEARALFAPAEAVEAARISPYRPLVDRFVGHPFALVALSARVFATGLLYVARVPGTG